MIFERRSTGVLLAALVAAGLLVMAIGAQVAAARQTRAASASRVIPVWAYVNGAYPVVGGRVVIMSGGRPVAQLGSRGSRRTNVNGVALVSVRQVPQRFTAVVRGGRVAGRRLRGGLRSLSEPGRGATVVEVNPLTALVAQLRDRRPGLGFGRASREVKRYFGVPWWADLGQNLRDGPRWFSAPRYIRAVSRYGSVDRLNRAVARKILSGGSRARLDAQATNRSAGGTRGANTVHAAGLTEGKGVTSVFDSLRAGALQTTGGTLVGGVFGGLLQLAKSAGVKPPESDFDQVKRQLSEIGAQVTQLQGEVAKLKESFANSDFSRLLGQSTPTIAAISRAWTNLQAVANASSDAQREALASETLTFIGNNLTDAPDFLDRELNPRFTIASNPIKAMSHALATARRFFGPRQSQQVRDVYDYYATAQAQLTVELTNYWNSKPVAYSVDFRKNEIEAAATSVTKTERESLKQTVPENTVIDASTRQMWTTNLPAGTGAQAADVNLRTIAEIDYSGRGPRYRLLKPAGPVALGGFPFGDWRIPSNDTFRGLIAGWNGVNPIDWLQREAGFNRQFLDVGDGRKWTRDIPSVTVILFLKTMDVRTFSLRTGNVYGDSAIAWVPNDAWMGEFDRFRAGLVYYRPIVAEHYWW